MKKSLPFILWILSGLYSQLANGQCCSAGSGSPIAGGTSQGVLAERQFEINLNYQYTSTNKFLNGDSKDTKFLDHYGSDYSYLRLAYGVSKQLTFSLECGYFFDKTQIGLNNRETIKSSGLSDLILFPRYTIYSRNNEKTKDEITIGLGYKIPIGAYNDSTKYVEPFSGDVYYIVNPPAVQPTTGSQDVIFYLFVFRAFPQRNFRIFSNLLYIRKGWNPRSEKFGDFSSISVYAGKTFFKKLGATVSLKGEWIQKMKFNQYLYDHGQYNYDVLATGTKKLSIVPQISYSYKDFTFYGLDDIPVYQYVNGQQIASQYQFTLGLSYRFFAKKQHG